MLCGSGDVQCLLFGLLAATASPERYPGNELANARTTSLDTLAADNPIESQWAPRSISQSAAISKSYQVYSHVGDQA